MASNMLLSATISIVWHCHPTYCLSIWYIIVSNVPTGSLFTASSLTTDSLTHINTSGEKNMAQPNPWTTEYLARLGADLASIYINSNHVTHSK